jgi:hypothetical protein
MLPKSIEQLPPAVAAAFRTRPERFMPFTETLINGQKVQSGSSSAWRGFASKEGSCVCELLGTSQISSRSSVCKRWSVLVVASEGTKASNGQRQLPKLARLRHANCAARCPLSGVTRKTCAHAEFF